MLITLVVKLGIAVLKLNARQLAAKFLNALLLPLAKTKICAKKAV